MTRLRDYRDAQGKVYSYDLLLFSLLLTELRGIVRQRHRVRWLRGNWHWISEVWNEMTGHPAPESSPSQSTLSRLLKKMDLWALVEQYHAERRATLQSNESGDLAAPSPKKPLRHYAIDGKTREGVVSPVTGRTEIDVTIFDIATREVLAQRTLPDKQGEAPAARAMLKRMGRQLDVGVFSGDAGIISPKLTATIVAAGHEYLLGLKGNAGDVFDLCRGFEWDRAEVICETHDEVHGRSEIRRLKRIALSHSRAKSFSKYADCRYLFAVESERTEHGETKCETRYFIGSRGLKGMTGEEILTFIRNHWLIENGLHWVKDAVLQEDDAPAMSNRSSRVLGFFRNVVVSVGYAVCRSVQKFVDEFDASPMKMTRCLFRLE